MIASLVPTLLLVGLLLQHTDGGETPAIRAHGDRTPDLQTQGRDAASLQGDGRQTPGQQAAGRETSGLQTDGRETPGLHSDGRQPDGGPGAYEGPSDSAAAAFRAAVRRLTSREFEQRNLRRRELQRRGYAAILHELLRRNGLGAFLTMVKTKAQLDLHLPQNTLTVTLPVHGPRSGDPRLQIFSPPVRPPMAFPLVEDRRFPEDPWKK